MRYLIRNEISGNLVGISTNSLWRAQSWIRRRGNPSSNVIIDTELDATWSFDPETSWTIDEDQYRDQDGER